METLPTILLGLRSIVLENINASPSELVYGTNLCLPYHFFEKSKPDVKADPATFVERFKTTMNKLKPVPASNHDKEKIFVHKDMENCTHVFIRHDGVKKPLQANYDPFQVISKTPKHYTVKVNGQRKTISLDRLKPMFSLSDSLTAEHSLALPKVALPPKRVRFFLRKN